jgi:cellulose synthase/poly-beta-1,6-N-acetylglucosamine synthase-like glycosyltransferase
MIIGLKILIVLSICSIFYIYLGYLLLLRAVSFFRSSDDYRKVILEEYPSLTILITVFNGEHEIKDKIDNILKSEYPIDKLKILVASDASNDATDQIVESYSDSRVTLYRSEENTGKTGTQNHAMKKVKSEITLFTDLGTRFDSHFLINLVSHFDDKVGLVGGNLLFLTKIEGNIHGPQSRYWSYELKLRSLESNLGILTKASGACLAIKTSLFRPMDISVGEDCILPLDVVQQGFRVVHASDAIATDYNTHSDNVEFKKRVRMTLRNWQGTFSIPSLINFKDRPFISLSIWSHKILRWLSPIFLFSFFVATFLLVFYEPNYLSYFLTLMASGYILLSIVGWAISQSSIKIPLVNIFYVFSLTNLGFLIALYKVIMRHKIYSFKDEN